MGDPDSGVPTELRVMFGARLWKAVEDFAYVAGRSKPEQFKFFLDAAVQAALRLSDVRLIPRQDWSDTVSQDFRPHIKASEEIREYLISQELEDIKYHEIVRQMVAVALETALGSFQKYGITKDALSQLIVKRYSTD